ncbi:MAG: DUF4194 domain-containing protein [Betaproteobacteria bacterium]|nr:MAG: DUF4194 domain-containing protein [Betaproteobacteria bacterium]TAG76878.1 MAG: DUF4194 domain-containing protein [Betaproteobacteria bacterium]
MNTSVSPPAPPANSADLSVLLIALLKGVVYREGDERTWSALIGLQARVRDYAAVLNLEVVLDESEGYAFLKSRAEHSGDAEAASATPLPRLVARRPLSYAVSLLLALLRKRLAEFDAGGAGTRLVLSRDEITDLVRVFLPDGPNEAKLIDGLETTINKVAELGFLEKLKPAGASPAQAPSYEVRRILKAFVDAQWLAEFDARLGAYQTQLTGVTKSAQAAA